MSRKKQHGIARMTDGFEVDKGPSGRVKLNVVSVANLVALLGLLGTAVASWTGINSRVDTINIRVQAAADSVAQIRADLNTSMLARDAEQRELRGKVELIGNRMTAVETILQRVETKLNTSHGQQ